MSCKKIDISLLSRLSRLELTEAERESIGADLDEFEAFASCLDKYSASSEGDRRDGEGDLREDIAKREDCLDVTELSDGVREGFFRVPQTLTRGED